ncbi:hypothetical protein EGY31_08085 [Burkholderia multivorans]|nr:hypothetical protein EGY31_08085 [Burkholderia multivorans]
MPFVVALRVDARARERQRARHHHRHLPLLTEERIHHPTSSIDVELHGLRNRRVNIAEPCGGSVKQGFLFSVKRNQSQVTSGGRDVMGATRCVCARPHASVS